MTYLPSDAAIQAVRGVSHNHNPDGLSITRKEARQMLESAYAIDFPALDGSAVDAEHLEWMKTWTHTEWMEAFDGYERAMRHLSSELQEAKNRIAKLEASGLTTVLRCVNCGAIDGVGSPQDARLFPMQDGPPIPWALAEAIYGTLYVPHYRQSVERLAERAGGGWGEVAVLWKERKEDREKCVQAVRGAGSDELRAALGSMIAAGDDIAEMAPHFISSRDVDSLRNYGRNIASIGRAALGPTP